MNLFFRCFSYAGFFTIFWFPAVSMGAALAANIEALPPGVAQALARAGVPKEAASFEIRAIGGDVPPRH